MGYSIDRLEVIKDRFIKSSPADLQLIFAFVKEQLDYTQHGPESNYTISFEQKVFEKMQEQPSLISPLELETLLAFVEERVEICRTSNRAERIMGQLPKEEFYRLEERYTAIEKFLLTITLG